MNSRRSDAPVVRRRVKRRNLVSNGLVRLTLSCGHAPIVTEAEAYPSVNVHDCNSCAWAAWFALRAA